MLHKLAGVGAATILELDRFYLPKSRRQSLSFDEPAALELSLAEAVVADLQLRGRADVPVYDFKIHDRVGSQPVTSSPLILVEGLFALWHAPLRDRFNLKIYVDAPHEERLARRVDRDAFERGRDAESVRRQWFESVLPMHDRFVEPTKCFADHIVDGCSDLERAARGILDLLTP
jgi:uridine kinase